MNINIPNNNIQIPDFFSFRVENDDDLGRVVRVYRCGQEQITFSSHTGSNSEMIQKATEEVIRTMISTALFKAGWLKKRLRIAD